MTSGWLSGHFPSQFIHINPSFWEICALVDAHLLDGHFESVMDAVGGQMLLRVLAREEPAPLGEDLLMVLP